MAKDMINGNPGKALFLFTVPMILGNVFQQMYSIIDSIIVGIYVGPDALAAVGASFSITFLFIAIAIGISVGSTVFLSQLFGSGQYTRMKTAISTILITVLGLSSVLMVVGLAINRTILKFMNTPSNILKDSETFLQIYFFGIIFLFLYNAITAVFNATGDSKTPLFILTFSTFTNIVLDFIFVIRFNMGVKGVALATLIAQGISVIIAFFLLMKRIENMNIQGKFSYYDKKDIINISKIAVPSILQQSIVSFGMLAVQSLVNSYGSIVVAGYTAAMRIDNIAILPMINVGTAMSTFTAQNIGAKKIERVKEGYRAAMLIVTIIGVVFAFFLFLFGDVFLGCFVNAKENPEVIRVGMEYLRIVSIFYFVLGIMHVSNGVLRGAADMKVFLLCTFVNLAVRVILAYSASYFIGESAVWWAIPVGWIAGFVVAYIRYKSGKWQHKSLVSPS